MVPDGTTRDGSDSTYFSDDPVFLPDQTGTPSAQRAWRRLIRQAIDWTRALESRHAATSERGSLHPTCFLEDEQGRVKMVAPPSLSPFELLRYMSPEQVGKLAVDNRSDLYSLGVILYRLWAKKVPFPSDSPLDLAHCHLAVKPEPLSRVLDCPPILDKMMARLLAKSPDARYASTTGLLDDLMRCDRELEDSGTISSFELGRFDRGSQFLIPNRLYGRDEEIAELDRIYDRAVQGEIVLCLVSGYSGIGKSALVRAILPHVSATGGRVIEGKYDQYQRETPYSAIIEAFRYLVRRVLAGAPSEVAEWRTRISEVLGGNGAVLTNVLPELVLLIGPQPVLPELSDTAAQARFNAMFAALLKQFANPQHPLVLFLDDLQWADLSSLALIRTFVREAVGAHLLLVGAYRDNEVDARHPLADLIAGLQRDKAPIAEFSVGPLYEQNVTQLIKDSLHRFDDPDGLARHVMRYTQGNPFFTRQFLTNMVRRGELAYDATLDGWWWNAPALASSMERGSVIELMQQRLSGLPTLTTQVMKTAACIGKQFPLPVLARVMSLSEAEVLTALAPALQEELVVPLDGLEQEWAFRFSHDRVQQAAYTAEGGDDVLARHLAIGLVLRELTGESDLYSAVFSIVDQLNLALPLVHDPVRRVEVAQLNRMAADRARTALAYDGAMKYLRAGEQCLPVDAWTSQYPLTYSLRFALAEAYSVLSLEESFNREIEDLLVHVRTPIDRLAVRIRQTIHICQSSRMLDGLVVGSMGLAEVGIHVPDQCDREGIHAAFNAELGRYREQMAGRNPREFLLALPRDDDPLREQIHRLIGAMGDAATITNTPLLSLLAAIGVNQTLRHGHTVLSPLMLTLLGQGLIAHLHAYEEAGNMASVAMELWEHLGRDSWTYGRTRVHQIWFILHWVDHIERMPVFAEEALALTRRAHDPLYGGYLLNIIVIAQHSLGAGTHDILMAHQRVVDHCKAYPAMGIITGFTQCYAGAAAALRGETASPTTIDGAYVNDAEHVERFQHMPMVLGLRQGARVSLLGFAGHWAEIIALADSPELAACPPFMPHRSIQFWRGVACARLAEQAEGDMRVHFVDGLSSAIDTLKAMEWSGTAENVTHRYVFLQAEEARVAGQKTVALEGYQHAIHLAARGGFVLEEAYFHEQLAALLEQLQEPCGRQRQALVDAQSGYLKAQAYLLQRRVEARLADLGMDRHTQAELSALDVVDTQAMLRAIRALSTHVDLTTLLPRLMKLILDLSGADRGAIVRGDGDCLTIEYARGIYRIDRLPQGTVRYVLHTGEAVALDNPEDILATGAAQLYGDDEHFRHTRMSSMLCQSVDRRTPAQRVLYLEFVALPQSLWPARQEVLSWLTAHAAIAIENAELYGKLEQRVQERTQALLQANARLRLREEELTAAREVAEHAARAKADFLASMSHEIRNPLNAILGLANVARQEQNAGRLKELVEKICRSGTHLTDMLNDVLDYSCVEAGRLDVQAVEFTMEELFVMLADVAAERAASKGIELIWHIDPLIPRKLRGDPLRLGQVLLNYCTNAVKYTERGEVEVSVRVEAWQGEQVMLSFAVRDTGCGIDPAVHSTLFRKFVRAQSGKQELTGSSGLGLAISKCLAELMGGEVGLRSEVGQGSEFWMRVPCGMAPEQMGIEPMRGLQGRCLLVVTNNAALRNAVATQLRHWKCRVTEAESDVEAKAALDADREQCAPFDAILLDERVFSPVRGWSRQAEALFSEHTLLMHQPLIKSRNGGFQELFPHRIEKPILPSRLHSVLVTMLSSSRSATSVPEPIHTDEEGVTALAAYRGQRVLVVEDSALNREVAVSLLELSGLVVDSVETGEQALLQIQVMAQQGTPYVLILMDLQMPVMDGMTATQKLRAMPEGETIPIIALTGNALGDIRQRCEAAGMNDILAKPFSPTHLYEVIAQWMAKQVSGEAAGATAEIPLESNGDKDRKSAAASLQKFKEIKGLQVERASMYMKSKESLYIKTVTEFIHEHQSFPPDLVDAIAERQWSHVNQYLHGIVGACGMVGATTLAALASVLEQVTTLLPDGTPSHHISTAIEHLREELSTLVTALACRL